MGTQLAALTGLHPRFQRVASRGARGRLLRLSADSLRRRGLDIEAIERRVAAFSVALPTWGAGRGGTRFAKFPFAGAPTDIHEKLEDCAVVQQLCRITPRVSPHFPWDFVKDYRGAQGRSRQPRARLSMPSTRTPSRISPGRSTAIDPDHWPAPMPPRGSRPSSTTSSASASASNSAPKRSRSGSAMAATFPVSRI